LLKAVSDTVNNLSKNEADELYQRWFTEKAAEKIHDMAESI